MTIRNITWFQQIFSDIRNEVSTTQNLNELRLALSALSGSQLASLIPDLPIHVLFDAINSSNSEQILASCEVLEIILPSIPPSSVLTLYSVEVNRALNHPVRQVKNISLKQLTRGVGHEELLHIFAQQETLMRNIILCLCDSELSVGNHSIEFFTKFGATPPGLCKICEPEVISFLIQETQKSEINQVRLYQFIVDVSVTSPGALEKLNSVGLIERLTKVINSNDILASLAVVEELTKLVVTQHGCNFLYENKIIELLVKQLVGSLSDSLASMVLPGLIKFFGHIGQRFPETLSAYPEVLDAVFQSVDSDDLPVAIAAMETVGFVGSSTTGKAMLMKQDTRYMAHIMSRMKDSITTFPFEWRVRSLGAVANVLHVDPTCSDATLSETTEVWYGHFGPEAESEIIKMTRQPFPEVKIGALRILLELAQQKWGQKRISLIPGLVTYLLDRTVETSLEGMQVKYEIVKAIYSSPLAREVFTEYDYLGFEEYVRQGPCYAPAQLNVAVEGE